MKIEEYGKENSSIIVMLHGANFVHCFGKQYCLSDKCSFIRFSSCWGFPKPILSIYTEVTVHTRARSTPVIPYRYFSNMAFSGC